MRNPKTEIRNPNSELENSQPGWAADSEFWAWGDETSNGPMTLREEALPDKSPARRDLLERTAQFGEAIIRFARKVPQNAVNNRLIDQLVGAGTSVGANYCEADNAVSGKEFKHRIGISRKESRETMFLWRRVATAGESSASEARALWREAKELNLIFGAIWRKQPMLSIFPSVLRISEFGIRNSDFSARP